MAKETADSNVTWLSYRWEAPPGVREVIARLCRGECRYYHITTRPKEQKAAVPDEDAILGWLWEQGFKIVLREEENRS